MPQHALTPALRAEYTDLFNRCAIRPERAAAVQTLVNALTQDRTRYAAVGIPLGIPWHVIAVIHNMESSRNFRTHLHNGDPLAARTTHVPAGRPAKGNPPFTWEASAADALAMQGLGAGTDWSLPGTLYQLEAYNGFGYRTHHPQVPSPYLWSFSTHYSAGKYIADGSWSDSAVSLQCGAAMLLRRMTEQNLAIFADQPPPTADARPMVVAYATQRPANPAAIAQAITLQNWLSSHPGIFLTPDGIAGRNTSDAYKRVTGQYLPGDPRGTPAPIGSVPAA